MLPSTFKYRKQVVVKKFSQKSNKRLMVGIITRETKREGQRKAKGCIVRRIQKKRERASPSCGRKIISPIAPLMSLAC
jgi:hypothetical protein